MEDGTVTLVGATTENPSFELNAALLSRARVMTFRALDGAAIVRLLARAEAKEGRALPLDAAARAALVRLADGDGRAALTLAEELWGVRRATARPSTRRASPKSSSAARRSTTRGRRATTIS